MQHVFFVSADGSRSSLLSQADEASLNEISILQCFYLPTGKNEVALRLIFQLVIEKVQTRKKKTIQSTMTSF